ncbi:glutamate receptor ionotropic, kainate 2-like isoform X2 [Daphnia carinata]|uniref:glutamate receptor ionotropic, kainate 2-like isoform X2 n=1 Tax=Daphnia carinata TaxID=120202 RepID=UPI00257E172C|nr:glutamate receptor ionotropic, kainate 2-like isoform X2 [Daphnia carinata]
MSEERCHSPLHCRTRSASAVTAFLVGYLLFANVRLSGGLPPVIKIGAIMTEEQRGSPTEQLFKYAVERINRDPELLPNTTLIYDIHYVDREDSWHTSKKACLQVQQGAHAIFGPSDPHLGAHVQSICDALEIPHLEARLDMDSEYKPYSINVYPPIDTINKAFMDVMFFLNWTKVAIIYEEDQGLVMLQDMIRAPTAKPMEILLRQASPDTYKDVLKEVKAKEFYNLVIDTKPENMNFFLKGVLQLQMNDYKYHYLFTTFDVETFDLEAFKYNFVNITAFRAVDSEYFRVMQTLKEMEKVQMPGYNHSVINRTRILQIEPALFYDSVHVFAHGLQALDRSSTLRLANMTCEDEVPWSDGSSLFNYINAVEYRGLTGPVQFREGRRTNFKFDLLKLKSHALLKVGEWTPRTGVNLTDPVAFFDAGTMNVTLVVTTNLEVPYVLLADGYNLTDNDRYEGFCVELIKEISRLVGFNYTIRLAPEAKYGISDPRTGEWNGIVRELMDRKADLAIGSMTINYARESVIDFTKPFMNLGISIMFKVPSKPPARIFSFMKPLTLEIWLYVLLAYALVSVTMFLVSRFSPYEWHNPYPCVADPTVIRNQFSLGNSFWFTVGTLMQQGSDLNPKAASTRIVGSIWWFFTLIIISSYTANLAAFLTVERMASPIESAQDLAEQREISYGILESGSTMTFFRDSKIETYQKMWRFMENKKPSVFVSTYEEGIRRVLEGNFAFLMESTTLDYFVHRNCNLTQIGGLLDSKYYGIATPIGSPWRDRISLAILELQEKGVIYQLYNKWWKNKEEVCNKFGQGKETKTTLGVDSIGGVFVVLLCGLAVAVLIAIIEFCWNSKKSAAYENQSLCTEMAEEFCFAVRCRGSGQRPAFKRKCSQCVTHCSYLREMDLASHHVPVPSNGLLVENFREDFNSSYQNEGPNNTVV